MNLHLIFLKNRKFKFTRYKIFKVRQRINIRLKKKFERKFITNKNFFFIQNTFFPLIKYNLKKRNKNKKFIKKIKWLFNYNFNIKNFKLFNRLPTKINFYKVLDAYSCYSKKKTVLDNIQEKNYFFDFFRNRKFLVFHVRGFKRAHEKLEEQKYEYNLSQEEASQYNFRSEDNLYSNFLAYKVDLFENLITTLHKLFFFMKIYKKNDMRIISSAFNSISKFWLKSIIRFFNNLHYISSIFFLRQKLNQKYFTVIFQFFYFLSQLYNSEELTFRKKLIKIAKNPFNIFFYKFLANNKYNRLQKINTEIFENQNYFIKMRRNKFLRKFKFILKKKYKDLTFQKMFVKNYFTKFFLFFKTKFKLTSKQKFFFNKIFYIKKKLKIEKNKNKKKLKKKNLKKNQKVAWLKQPYLPINKKKKN